MPRYFPRMLMFIALLCLTGVFLFPLWKITLDAAQFPGGLELNIWINKFSGKEEGDYIIQNINILNHYIGMQHIEPDSIPELTYFPYVIYGMIMLGLLVIWLNKKWGYGSWFILLCVLGALGIYDFYSWMYDYGHNLDPNAPITIPGMTYMPPLLGEKDLLNFYVTSYPAAGTVFLSISIALSALAFFFYSGKKYTS